MDCSKNIFIVSVLHVLLSGPFLGFCAYSLLSHAARAKKVPHYETIVPIKELCQRCFGDI